MGGSISALKPGPVVPPGIEKTPDQAARISQSVDFAHLSDILAFFGYPPFFTLFCHFFTFLFCHFFPLLHFLILSLFAFSWFSHFYCFLYFCHFYWFCVFSLFFHVFQFRVGYLKDKALFWPLFLTVVLSHGKHFEGVNSLCEIWAPFFCHFCWFWLIFGHFLSFLVDFSFLPLRNHFFWLIFDHFFWSLFVDFYFFYDFFDLFLSFMSVFDPPSIPVNKCPFGSQKGP